MQSASPFKPSYQCHRCLKIKADICIGPQLQGNVYCTDNLKYFFPKNENVRPRSQFLHSCIWVIAPARQPMQPMLELTLSPQSGSMNSACGLQSGRHQQPNSQSLGGYSQLWHIGLSRAGPPTFVPLRSGTTTNARVDYIPPSGIKNVATSQLGQTAPTDEQSAFCNLHTSLYTYTHQHKLNYCTSHRVPGMGCYTLKCEKTEITAPYCTRHSILVSLSKNKAHTPPPPKYTLLSDTLWVVQ